MDFTKQDIANLAERVRHHAKQLTRESERLELWLASEALIALSNFDAVEWPIAIGPRSNSVEESIW